jgi:hypothetical protein
MHGHESIGVAGKNGNFDGKCERPQDPPRAKARESRKKQGRKKEDFACEMDGKERYEEYDRYPGRYIDR